MTRTASSFPAALRRRGAKLIEDAPLVNPRGRRRLLEARLLLLAEAVVALKAERDLFVRDELQRDGRRVAAVAELVRDAHLARVLDVDDLELRGAGRAALADRHDDQLARTVSAELRDEARAHVALDGIDFPALEPQLHLRVHLLADADDCERAGIRQQAFHGRLLRRQRGLVLSENLWRAHEEERERAERQPARASVSRSPKLPSSLSRHCCHHLLLCRG